MVAGLARAMVGQPDAVAVEEERHRGMIVISLEVDERDLGRVIGRGGRTAHALRTIVRSAGDVHGERYRLEILD